MKKLFIFILLIFSVSFANAQCKYVKKGIRKKAGKQFTNEITSMTKPKLLFDKLFNVSTGAFFINADGEYFFILYYQRAYSSKFEIIEDHKLIINFENDIDLILKACENVESKNIGISLNHYIWSAYKISKEQIEIFAKNPLFNMKIYFTSENQMENTFEDDSGWYFEFDILSEKKKSNLVEPANCFLQLVSN